MQPFGASLQLPWSDIREHVLLDASPTGNSCGTLCKFVMCQWAPDEKELYPFQETLAFLTQESKQLLTKLAVDLSAKLLNFRNLSEIKLPKDKITNKKYQSLTRALAKVTNISGRSITQQWPNYFEILYRHCNFSGFWTRNVQMWHPISPLIWGAMCRGP